MKEAVLDLIQRFNLLPHPEGGYYSETYRSHEIIELPDRFSGPRSVSTGIYYLLEHGDFSSFHRIRSDEMWHFYAGDPIIVHVLKADGACESFELGRGLRYQAVVPAEAWFAAESSGAFSFVGCTVAPGFDFADFEMADRAELSAAFPDQKDLISRMTREALQD